MSETVWINQALGALEGVLFWTDPAAWSVISGEACDLQLYDDLFKGTDADIYIPLWASVCAGTEDTLMNSDTLEAIRLYYSFGYRPVPMDGNPPDYIGQLLRFYLYLTLGLICGDAYGRDSDADRGTEEAHPGRNGGIAAAREHLLQRFLLDTLFAVLKGMEAQKIPACFRDFSRRMRLWALQEDTGEPGVFGAAASRETLEQLLQKYDPELCRVLERGINAPLPLAPAHVENTAGRNNCGGKCVIRVTVQEGCLLNIETDCGTGDPPIKACVKGRSYLQTFMSPRRLRYPMVRREERGSGRFRRISWEEAGSRIMEDLDRITREYGPGSRYAIYATGFNACTSPLGFIRRFLHLDGGRLGYYNSYSTACTKYVTPYIYGDNYSGNSIEDIVHSRLVILWGNNFAETVFGSHRNHWMMKAKERGTRFIAIDPRYSDTAACYADQWIGIRPSTDGALADGLAFVMVEEGLYDKTFLDRYCIGFDEEHMPEGIPAGESYLSYLTGRRDGVPKTPAWASDITGVPEETIRKLAREMAGTRPMCILPGWGNQRTGNGEQTVRQMALLACMTGNIGIPGGGAAGSGMIPKVVHPEYPEGSNPYPGAIPVFLWSEAVRRGPSFTADGDGLRGVDHLAGGIKMIFNPGGNTLVNQHSDINATVRILRDETLCESIVTTDIFMTPSARFSDYVLPAAALFEADNIAGSWDGFNDYLLSVKKIIEPLFGSRYEYEVTADWAERRGIGEAWRMGCGSNLEMLEMIYNEARTKEPGLPSFEVFREQGGCRLDREKPYIAYEDQIRDPSAFRFSTPSGKIEIFSKSLYDMGRPEDIPGIPKYVPCPGGPGDPLIREYPLQLIGWHTRRRTHSIHDNNPLLEEIEPPCLWLHPADAGARGISDGDLVEVYNRRGRCRVPAKVTNRIIQGVCAMAQGAWYTPDKEGVDMRGSINVLTSVIPTPLAKGNPQHSNLVEVVKYKAENE